MRQENIKTSLFKMEMIDFSTAFSKSVFSIILSIVIYVELKINISISIQDYHTIKPQLTENSAIYTT